MTKSEICIIIKIEVDRNAFILKISTPCVECFS
nr:MAG TPA: hypothetical protein [Caudoviricetes sp.]